MFLSSSFLNLTVWTPEMALTRVDFPCATWPIVPMLIVAWRAMTSGESGLSVVGSTAGAESAMMVCAAVFAAVPGGNPAPAPVAMLARHVSSAGFCFFSA